MDDGYQPSRPLPAELVAANLGTTVQELRGCLGGYRGLVWLRPGTLIAPVLIRKLAADLPKYRAEQARRSRAAAELEAALVTTSQGAELLRVAPETIRQWVARGHLAPIGKLGHRNLYRYRDLKAAAAAVHDRTPQGPAVDYRIGESDHTTNVTTAIAAQVVRVQPGTIRMWVQRGHLKPVGRYRGRLVFRLGDVIAVAEREP